MAQKVVIVEANEIPLRVFRTYAESNPGSMVAKLLDSGSVVETVASDVPDQTLYPSQTWASMNMGVPSHDHRVHWYNDPKPEAYPLYWQTVADHGYSVGLVNTLHSSPASRFVDHPNIKFLIPDCFAPDAQTKPAAYERFQQFNIRASAENQRTVKKGLPIRDGLTLAASMPLGVSPWTLAYAARSMASMMVGTATRERLRNVQFPLLADMFLHLLKRFDVDLSVIFSNHVAGNMHRFWYAAFPHDFEGLYYDEQWVARNRQEISHAMGLLDRFLAQLLPWCERTDRCVVVMSSMGQRANEGLSADATSNTSDFVVRDLTKLLDALGVAEDTYELRRAMHPQLTVEFEHAESAANAAREIMRRQSEDLQLRIDQHGPVMTLTLSVNSKVDLFQIDGRAMRPDELGLRKVSIDNHHSGRHDPIGTLIFYNGPTLETKAPLNYLEVAPTLLALFGIRPLAHMRQPAVQSAK